MFKLVVAVLIVVGQMCFAQQEGPNAAPARKQQQLDLTRFEANRPQRRGKQAPALDLSVFNANRQGGMVNSGGNLDLSQFNANAGCQHLGSRQQGIDLSRFKANRGVESRPCSPQQAADDVQQSQYLPNAGSSGHHARSVTHYLQPYRTTRV